MATDASVEVFTVAVCPTISVSIFPISYPFLYFLNRRILNGSPAAARLPVAHWEVLINRSRPQEQDERHYETLDKTIEVSNYLSGHGHPRDPERTANERSQHLDASFRPMTRGSDRSFCSQDNSASFGPPFL